MSLAVARVPRLAAPSVLSRLADPWLGAAVALGVFAFLIRVASADQQSAYMDEGTNVLTGRMLLEQRGIYAEILNWAYGSYLWPLVAGLADERGGLAWVRGVTSGCGVLMVLATAMAAWRLTPGGTSAERRRAIALIAAGIMAIAPTAIGVSRFGTYDAMAGAAFMLGATLLLPSFGSRVPALQLLCAALLLFVAFLAKYLVAIYFPVVCVYVMTRHGRDVKAATREIALFVAPLTFMCAIYGLIFLAPLVSLLTSSLHYADLKSSDPLREYVWTRPELWIVLASAAYGWRFATWRARAIGVAGAAVILGFQVVARPDFDFWKHSIYVIYFMAPLAALSWLRVPQHTGTWRVVGALAGGLVALAAWSPAIEQTNRLIDFYPNLNPSLGAIQNTIADSALVLTDDTALRYYVYPAMQPDRVVGPFAFTYQAQSGIDAYRSAITDRYFDAIVLDGGVTPQGNAIRDQLGKTIQDYYQRVYSRTDGGFTVEVLKPLRPAGAAAVTAADLNWPETFTFDAGTDGWGSHPDNADWQAGSGIRRASTPSWNGHASLQFTPAVNSTSISLRRAGHVTRVRARVYVTSADASATPVRVGFMGFDSAWQWHDDGFRWIVPPDSWTTISWDLPSPADYVELGLKFPGGVGQAYVGSFEIEP